MYPIKLQFGAFMLYLKELDIIDDFDSPKGEIGLLIKKEFIEEESSLFHEAIKLNKQEEDN